MNSRFRLKVRDDGRYEVQQPVIATNGTVYTIIIERDQSEVLIENASGVTVAQIENTTGRPMVELIQAAKNYLVASLSVILPMHVSSDSGSSVVTIPTNKTVAFGNTPTSGSYKLSYASALTSLLVSSSTAAQVQTALRLLPTLADVTVSGTFGTNYVVKMSGVASVGALTSSTNTLQIDQIQKVEFSAVPTSGVFTLSYNGNACGNLNYNATAAQVQTALRLVTGLSTVTVSGNFTSGFLIVMVGIASPFTLVEASNTLLITATPVTTTITIDTARAATSINIT